MTRVGTLCPRRPLRFREKGSMVRFLHRLPTVPGGTYTGRHIRLRAVTFGACLILIMLSLPASGLTLIGAQSRDVHSAAGTIHLALDRAAGITGAVWRQRCTQYDHPAGQRIRKLRRQYRQSCHFYDQRDPSERRCQSQIVRFSPNMPGLANIFKADAFAPRDSPIGDLQVEIIFGCWMLRRFIAPPHQ